MKTRFLLLLTVVATVVQISRGEPVQDGRSPQSRLLWFLGDEEQVRVIEQLIDQLDSESFVEREGASRKLAALPSLPAFARRLASTDDRPEVRSRLNRIVTLRPVARETTELNAILKQIADEEIAGTLGMLARIVAAEIWDPDRILLAHAVDVTVTAADLPLIEQSLAGNSPPLRQLAATAYGSLPDAQSSAPLRQLLNDADEAVALLAAEALAVRNEIASLAAFARLLDSPDFNTRHRTWSALKGLSAKSFGFDPSDEEETRRAAAHRWQEWSRSPDAGIVGELPKSSVISLFNGKDLNGWTVFGNGQAAHAQKIWDAQGGALVSLVHGHGEIRTDASFENYILTLQYKIDGAAGDGGIGIMLTKENENVGIGVLGAAGSYLEVQILPRRTGDLYLIGGFQAQANGIPIQFFSPRTVQADDRAGVWHRLKLTVSDGKAEIELNGTVVNRASEGAKGPGKIALRNEGHRISYKDILIHPLAP